MTTHYELLGVAPQATSQEIHDAYLKSLHDFQESLSRPIHADHTKIGLLQAAYKTLSDPATRAAYDQTIELPLAAPVKVTEQVSPVKQEIPTSDPFKNLTPDQMNGVDVWSAILAAESNNTKKDIFGGVIFMIVGIPPLLAGIVITGFALFDLVWMHRGQALADIGIGALLGGLLLFLGIFATRLALTKLTGRDFNMKFPMQTNADQQPIASDKSQQTSSTQKGEAIADSGQRKVITAQERFGHVASAFGLLAYGGFGLHQNDLYIPGKHSKGVHLHGTAAWIMYGAFICASLNLLSVAADHCDSSEDERYYHIFARVTQIAGWTLFIGALVASFFIHDPQW